MNADANTCNSLLDAALDAMAAGDAAGAVSSFERVLAIDPRHAEARHGMVRALEDAGRVEEALRVTEQLIAEDPDDVLAVTRLSMLYQHQGKIAEAEAAAARAKILGWKQELRSGVSAKTTL
jgi:tetratricopeptide (TPR) repeat protein